MLNLQVFQIRLKIYLLAQIAVNEIQTKVASFIDQSFIDDETLSKMHENNCFKNYCVDMPYPLEVDKQYKKDKIYTLTVRTVDRYLATHFHEELVNTYTSEMKGLTAEIRVIPPKKIERLYSITPVILKDEQGYWRKNMNIEDYENRLKINLIKKWNGLHDEKMPEDFDLYTMLEFLNHKPVPMEYKGIRLLGDKIRLQISDHPFAQELAYMALGAGVGEMNARGAGFMNYRWY